MQLETEAQWVQEFQKLQVDVDSMVATSANSDAVALSSTIKKVTTFIGSLATEAKRVFGVISEHTNKIAALIVQVTDHGK